MKTIVAALILSAPFLVYSCDEGVSKKKDATAAKSTEKDDIDDDEGSGGNGVGEGSGGSSEGSEGGGGSTPLTCGTVLIKSASVDLTKLVFEMQYGTGGHFKYACKQVVADCEGGSYEMCSELGSVTNDSNRQIDCQAGSSQEIDLVRRTVVDESDCPEGLVVRDSSGDHIRRIATQEGVTAELDLDDPSAGQYHCYAGAPDGSGSGEPTDCDAVRDLCPGKEEEVNLSFNDGDGESYTYWKCD